VAFFARGGGLSDISLIAGYRNSAVAKICFMTNKEKTWTLAQEKYGLNSNQIMMARKLGVRNESQK